MIVELVAIITPLFVCTGIGYLWARLDRPYDTDFVTTLVTNFATPCLIFTTLANARLDGQAISQMAGAALAALATFAVVGAAVLALARLPIRSFLPPLVFANTGNMGLPLCLLAFGEHGLALAIVYFTVGSVAMFTLGVGLTSGASSVRQLLRVPMLYAVVLALPFLLGGVQPPAWLDNTTRLIGGMMVPLMIITLGISLARLRVGGMKRSLALAVLRLGMGLAVGVGLADVLGLEGTARGVLVIQAAMPAAVFNYLFALRYERSPEEVAGMVVASTLLSFLTLPLLMWSVL
jgi:hypothetical protein